MNIDIIALAKKHGGRFHGPNIEHLSIPETAFVSMMAELETEIRKEFEAELIKLKDEAKTARVEAECLAASCKSVTAQNAKLMEAAEKYKKACEMLERLYVNSSSLTQPEKEGKE